jgi:hypothetical protein
LGARVNCFLPAPKTHKTKQQHIAGGTNDESE